MRRFMLLVGMGYALVAGSACRARPDTPLTTAAASNDADAVRRLLASGHQADEGGDALTALMWAARENATAAMRALVDGGADVNRRDHRNRWTPLLHAIHRPSRRRCLVLMVRSKASVYPVLQAINWSSSQTAFAQQQRRRWPSSLGRHAAPESWFRAPGVRRCVRLWHLAL